MLHNAYFEMYVTIPVAMFCVTAEHVLYTSIMLSRNSEGQYKTTPKVLTGDFNTMDLSLSATNWFSLSFL